MTEMALDETGSTGQGKGGSKHAAEWRRDLSVLVEFSSSTARVYYFIKNAFEIE